MSQPYVGEIRMFAGNFAPAGWMFCNGGLLPISEYETLFNLIGTTYGGDGQSTFALPNLQSRVPIHQGNGYTLAETGGAENVTLSASQIPAHFHTAMCSFSGNAAGPVGNFWATDPGGNTAAYNENDDGSQMAANAIGPTGGSQPHTNLQPFLAINFIISLFGIFPSET